MGQRYVVERVGSWFTRLADTVRKANMGDTIVVDDTEMMSFACFGIRSRGFKDSSKQFGITVELPDGTVVGVDKVTARATQPSSQNVPKHLDYPDEQVFICQHCSEPYQFGPAREVMRDSGQTKYTPLAFCSAMCGFRYHYKHGRGPAVVAEIPLGKPELCNLHKFTASESVLVDPDKPNVPIATVYDESHETLADPMGLDKVANLFGLTPGEKTQVEVKTVQKIPPLYEKPQ